MDLGVWVKGKGTGVTRRLLPVRGGLCLLSSWACKESWTGDVSSNTGSGILGVCTGFRFPPEVGRSAVIIWSARQDSLAMPRNDSPASVDGLLSTLPRARCLFFFSARLLFRYFAARDTSAASSVAMCANMQMSFSQFPFV